MLPLFAPGAPAPSAEAVKPLAIGARVPDVRLRSADEQEVALAPLLRGGKTVLIFYRGGWCPYCNKHLAELAELEPELLELGWQIIALSPDSPAALTPTSTKNKTSYRLLSDRAMRAADAFGVAFRVDEATVKKYREYQIDLPPVPGDSAARWLPVPAVFLVDRDLGVRFSHVNADYKNRLSAEALLAAARAVR